MKKINSLLNPLPFQGKGAASAFTLVELIVVITILAILGTIAFISLQGYSRDARDGVRVSDMSRIKTGLELFQLDAGKYPETTDPNTVTYLGALAWTQGDFGDSTFSNVEKLDKIPTDPVTDRKYIYSVTNTRQEYQIAGIMEGDEVSFSSPLPLGEGLGVRAVNAATKTARVKINGNYNGKLLKVGTGGTDHILAVPSIITASGFTLENIAQENTFVYNGYKNLPAQYIGSSYEVLGEEGLNLVNIGKLVLFSGDIKDLSASTNSGTLARADLIAKLQEAYTGTTISNVGEISEILNTTGPEAIESLASIIVSNDLGGSITASKNQQDTITETCTDGKQNQDETGVDCGGSCGACPITCPTGYVLVPGSSTFSTSDFCVAKYEMKDVSGVATSQASLTPWVSITQPDAITACNAIGTGYHLITNNEWMTIARNIEANSQNWANGIVGSLVSTGGGLYRGNVNLSDSISCGSNTVLDGNTSGTNCEVSGRNKRMHILSNGNEIWDLSGNVWEHVNGSNNISSTDGVVNNGQACSTTISNRYSFYLDDAAVGGTCPFNANTFYSKANHGPLGYYNADNGVGRIYSSTSTNRIFYRGGTWGNTTNAGVFVLLLNRDSSDAYANIGFRCAFSVN